MKGFIPMVRITGDYMSSCRYAYTLLSDPNSDVQTKRGTTRSRL